MPLRAPAEDNLAAAGPDLLRATGKAEEPYRLLDPADVVIEPAAEWFAGLHACSKPATTIRSYGMDLLRWYRFPVDAGDPVGQGAPCSGSGRRGRDPRSKCLGAGEGQDVGE